LPGTVGLTAGASTPDDVIAAVERRLIAGTPQIPADVTQ
jgi:4-hydroxy-3-methylbut-2-enyl diphosphate reductase IspH